LEAAAPGGTRRGFFAQAAAVICGAVSLLVPAAIGVVAFLNPLRQKGQAGGFLRLASLGAVPEDGMPQKFAIIADRSDAWNRFPNEPIGAVFLRRVKDGVQALQVICPHAGCSINYESASGGGRFFCPCHAAAFDLTGKRLDATSMSPRDMDALEVEIRSGSEVWVKFQNFHTGTPLKVAQA
jgi:nitrite reductase/ring-hydroxylating ferredoxin subunit